jgi:hypothetical protein
MAKGLVTRKRCVICCILQMRFGASAISCLTRIPFYIFLHQIADVIWCAIPCPFCSCAEIVHAPNCMHQIAQQIANQYRMIRVNGSNPLSDTKSQMHRIASAICSKTHMKSHTCNQPLRGRLHLRFVCAVWMCSEPSAAMTCVFYVQQNSQPIS